MKDSIIIDGKEYISSRRASEMTKYSNDYVGQLCRMKKVESRKVGRIWFIEKESLLVHQRDAEVIIHSGPYISSQKVVINQQNMTSAHQKSVSSLAPSLPTTKYSSVNLMTHSEAELASFPVIVPDITWKITTDVSAPVVSLVFVAVGTYTMTNSDRVFRVAIDTGTYFEQSFASSGKEFTDMFARMSGRNMAASAIQIVNPLEGNVLDASRVGMVSSVLKLMGVDISQ